MEGDERLELPTSSLGQNSFCLAQLRITSITPTILGRGKNNPFTFVIGLSLKKIFKIVYKKNNLISGTGEGT